MYLKRLDIHGFKTFAARTTFVFPPGITAVVGPNGSGKSNVADALRWVLGEQSFANLRCKKTEDLIYGGGKGRAPLGFAEVALTIDNTDRLLPLPYDEVTVGRRAYRSGENEYFVNRARVRLRDLLDVVAPLGSSFTLINQGLVDAALALQPEDRQKLFEDAAEIGPYQAKKAEAGRRLRETEANLVRLSDVLQEQEPQLRALKRQARDAEAVGVVEAELDGVLRRSHARILAAAAAAVAAAQGGEAAAAAELQVALQHRATAAGELQTGRDGVRERRAELATLREAEADLNHRIAASLRERAVADERAAGLRRRRDELLEREQTLREQQALAAGEAGRLQSALERDQAALADRRAAAAERARLAGDLLSSRAAAEQALAAARREVVRRTAAHGALEARHAQLRGHLESQDRDIRSLEGEIATAEVSRQAEAERLAAAAELLARADRVIRDCEAAIDAAQHGLRVARDEREAAGEQLAAARRGRADLRARHETLARLVQSWEGSYPGVKAAMQWAARAGQADFKLVASILRVPPELETAVEVTLGGRLQQIVVDRWDAAEAAIAELKRANAGRATFLPLDTLRPARRLAAGGAEGRPGILGRAAEMIDYAPRYEQVVDLLLGRTLIAADLAAARAALKSLEGGWGIVTLAGEQIATSGVLTGGAATREAGTLRREREYRDLPRRIEEAEAEVNRLLELADVHEERVRLAADALRAAETALRDARVHRDQQQRALETRRRDLHRAEDTHQALLRRVERLRDEQTTAQGWLAAATAELAALQSELDAATAAAGGAEAHLHERQAVARGEEEALQALRTALVQAESEVRERTQATERARRQAAQATEELGTIGARVDGLTTDLHETTRELEALRGVEQTLAEEARLLAARLDPLASSLPADERRLQALEEAERATTAEVLRWERLHADAVIKLQAWRSDRRVAEERAAGDGVDPFGLDDEPLDHGESPAELGGRIEQLRGRLRRMGPVNALAQAEYAALLERHTFLAAQLDDVRTTTATLRDAIRELDELMDSQFHATFTAVAHEFSAAFTRLFGGGSARLSLVGAAEDGDDSAGGRRGVDIVAQPPGKRQLHLQLLSGGERALTAAALLFAILKHHPRPFCLMDEVDAALDEANVVRFREALQELAEGTQFIIVTHNRGTVEVANTLYGISMAEDGSSRVLSLRFVEGQNELVEAVA